VDAERKGKIEADARAYIVDAVGSNRQIPESQIEAAIRRVVRITEKYVRADEAAARVRAATLSDRTVL